MPATGHVDRSIVRATRVIDTQAQAQAQAQEKSASSGGRPTTPSTVARGLTWHLLRLVQSKAAKEQIKAAHSAIWDPSHVHSLWHLQLALVTEAYTSGAMDLERYIWHLGQLQDSGRRLSHLSMVPAPGPPSAHGLTAPLVHVDVHLPGDADPGDILRVG